MNYTSSFYRLIKPDNSSTKVICERLATCLLYWLWYWKLWPHGSQWNSKHVKHTTGGNEVTYIDNNTITYLISDMKVYCDFNKCALQRIEFRHRLLFTLPIAPPTHISCLILAGLKIGQTLLCNTHNPVPFIHLLTFFRLSQWKWVSSPVQRWLHVLAAAMMANSSYHWMEQSGRHWYGCQSAWNQLLLK